MPLIRPLRALRYGSDAARQLDLLVSPATQGEPTDRRIVGDVHELNIRQIVRGDRGELAHDDEPKFTHAARLVERWKQDGIIVRDPRPAMYVYAQEEAGRERRGLVALVRLTPYDEGVVLPHEETRGGSTEQLAAQLATTRTQLSLVMAVVPDACGVLASVIAEPRDHRAHISALDGHGRTNRVWRGEDPGMHLELIEALREEVAVIADGHHRYEAALRHQAKRNAEEGGRRERPWDYAMMLLVPASDSGLRCDPTHRVCPTLPEGAAEAVAGLDRWFEITDVDSDDALFAFLQDPEGTRFGLVCSGARRALRLRDDLDRAEVLGQLPEALRDVDAAVLDELVLGRLAVEGGASGSAWAHNHSSGRSVAQRAYAGEVELAFILRPTPPARVVEVAAAGHLMPAKSTNFVPKPTKGLLMASLVSF